MLFVYILAWLERFLATACGEGGKDLAIQGEHLYRGAH